MAHREQKRIAASGHRDEATTSFVCAFLFFFVSFAFVITVPAVAKVVPQPKGQRVSEAIPSVRSPLPESGYDPKPLLSAATLVSEGPTSTRYIVHVHLPSGADQFISVSAPPGGLELEVEDMSGDHVQNDLILRPAVLHWPLTVLLNDGKDHFTVAISGVFPDRLESGETASQGHPTQDRSVLASSGAKTNAHGAARRLLFLGFQEDCLPRVARIRRMRLDHRVSSGRAPPMPAALLS